MSGPRAALQAADALLVEHEQREQREQNAWRTAELGAHLGQASAALDAGARGRRALAEPRGADPDRGRGSVRLRSGSAVADAHTSLRHADPAGEPAELRGAGPDRGRGGDRSVGDPRAATRPSRRRRR
jgi:hypothetical protein